MITANINEGPPKLVAVSRAMLVGSGYTDEWAGVAQDSDRVQIKYIARSDDKQIAVDITGPCNVNLEDVSPGLVLPGPMAPFHLWSIVGANGSLQLRITYSIGGLPNGTATSVVARAIVIYWDYSWWIDGLYAAHVAEKMLNLAQVVAHAWHPCGEAQISISHEGWTLNLYDRLRSVFLARRRKGKVSCIWKTWDDLDPTDPVLRQVYSIPELPFLPVAASPFGDTSLIGVIANWASTWSPPTCVSGTVRSS